MNHHSRFQALFGLLMLTIVMMVMNLNFKTEQINTEVNNLLAQVYHNPSGGSQVAGPTTGEPIVKKYFCEEFPGSKKYAGWPNSSNPTINNLIGNQGVKPKIDENQPGWGISWKAYHRPMDVLRGGGTIVFLNSNVNGIPNKTEDKNVTKYFFDECQDPSGEGSAPGTDDMKSIENGYYNYKGKTREFENLKVKRDVGKNCYLPPVIPAQVGGGHTGTGGATGGGTGGNTPKFNPPDGGTTGGGGNPPVDAGGNNPEGGNNQNPTDANSQIFDHSILAETNCTDQIEYKFLTSKKKVGYVDLSGDTPPALDLVGPTRPRNNPNPFRFGFISALPVAYQNDYNNNLLHIMSQWRTKIEAWGFLPQ